MIKALIIDDEQHCINRLSVLIEEHFSQTIQVAGSFQTVEEAVIGIRKIQPDLIFLDVQIGDKSGFDLLKQLNDINFEIIFTTAYEKYAVQAFRFSALDYLLKPVDADDLKAAIHKLKELRSRKDTAGRLDVLFHNMKNLQGSSKRICVPVVNGMVFLQVNDIVRCQSDINYTTIFLKDGKSLVVAKTLKDFEAMLSEYNFFRVHNSHMINLNYIKSYNKGKGGYITMTDNSSVEVSTRRKEEFLKKLESI